MEEKVALQHLSPEVQNVLLVDAYGADTIADQLMPYVLNKHDFAMLARLVLQHDSSAWARTFRVIGDHKPDHTTILIGDPEGKEVASFGRIVMSMNGMKPMESPDNQFDLSRFINERFKIEGIELDPAQEDTGSRVQRLIRRVLDFTQRLFNRN